MKNIQEIIEEITKLECQFYFATNSISFTFEGNSIQIGNYRVWIDPFWRFVKNGKIVLGSYSCPWHEDYESNEEYTKAFHFWCDTVNYLKTEKLKTIKIQGESNDLIIEWTDGTRLEVYQDDNEEEGWYIRNTDNEEDYGALPGKKF